MLHVLVFGSSQYEIPPIDPINPWKQSKRRQSHLASPSEANVVAPSGDLLVLGDELGAHGHPVAESSAVGAPPDARDECELLLHVLGVVKAQQDGGNPLLGLLKQVLEVQKRALGAILVVHKGGRDAGLAAAPRSADSVHVVLDLTGHVVIDHVLRRQ